MIAETASSLSRANAVHPAAAPFGSASFRPVSAWCRVLRLESSGERERLVAFPLRAISVSHPATVPKRRSSLWLDLDLVSFTLKGYPGSVPPPRGGVHLFARIGPESNRHPEYEQLFSPAPSG